MNAVDSGGYTVLNHAFHSRLNCNTKMQVVRSLINADANVNAVKGREESMLVGARRMTPRCRK